MAIATESHPFPSRTRKLSLPAPMVLGGRLPGRVGRRRISQYEASPFGGASYASREGVGWSAILHGSWKPPADHPDDAASHPTSPHRPCGAKARSLPQGTHAERVALRSAKKKTRRRVSASGQEKMRQRPTLPHGFPCSTIGSGGLNFRVRDGNGCDPTDIATAKSGKDRRREAFSRPNTKGIWSIARRAHWEPRSDQ